MEPVLALNYPVPMFDELLGFFGSGSEPGSIPTFLINFLLYFTWSRFSFSVLLKVYRKH